MQNKYFIGISNGAITKMNADQNAAYTIYANDQELKEIRSKLESMQDADMASHLRSHIPINPYHEDPQNDEYDANLKELFQMLHKLGDEQAKEHIDALNILPEDQ